MTTGYYRRLESCTHCGANESTAADTDGTSGVWSPGLCFTCCVLSIDGLMNGVNDVVMNERLSLCLAELTAQCSTAVRLPPLTTPGLCTFLL